MEDTDTEGTPRPDTCTIQLPEQPTSAVGPAERSRVKEKSQDKVRSFSEVQKRSTVSNHLSAGGPGNPGWPVHRACIERARGRLEGTCCLERPVMGLHRLEPSDALA
mmetsp:Transcript_140223/g.349528  ORF Transcript_140223/g.349528 Transcript_140223/m.349528 type:complete len:107 (-) Transcript_140223:7-327(-)